MRLLTPCPICSKNLELLKETTIGSTIFQSFKCGHAFAKQAPAAAEPDDLDFFSVDGKKQARDYQKEGVRFILNSGFSCVIGDQMRLGKTPQSLLALKNAFQQGKRKQALILVRAANLWQWTREAKTWVDNKPNAVWVIQGTKSWIPPGFQMYIMSMDTFGRRGTCKSCEHQFHEEECKKCIKEGQSCRICVPAGDAMSDVLGFDVVIVDEAHSFKNTDSQRSQALTAFLREIERSSLVHELPFNCPFCKEQWSVQVEIKTNGQLGEQRVSKTSSCPKCFKSVSMSAAAHVKVQRNCGVVMLTGTAIKNRADEYFVPLNLVAPERFPSLESFRRKWLIQDAKGSYSRVSPYAFEEFKKQIAPYVLRREKEDVYKDLPALNRIFTVIEVEDEKLKKLYNKVLDNIEAGMSSKGDFNFFNSIGELQQLRQICGLAKVNWISDYAEQFVSGSENAKLAIGVHHHAVRDSLAFQLERYGTLKLSGEDSPQRKDQIMRKFETSHEQILIINMLAGGVGMDFHYCDNALIAERQWSSADEEQFEFRFYNPDPSIKTRPTNIEYVVAKGTIDQFFYEMVEEKRAIFGETISNNWSVQDDPTSFKQLIERTVASRL